MSTRRLVFDEQSLTLRGILIAVLVLAMLIPVGMIGGIVDERYERYRDVVQEIGTDWGGLQTVAGPVVVVPFTERWTEIEDVESNGERKSVQHQYTRDSAFVVLPSTLDINAKLDVERRNRGIYEAMVYTSSVAMDARFDMPELAAARGRRLELHWPDATLALGIAGPVGIRSVDVGAGVPVRAPEPGTALGALPSGVHWKLRDAQALLAGGRTTIALALNGAEELAFLPFGGTTEVRMQSVWPHPSFIGTIPAERRVTSDGFEARWRISSLSRNYPQLFESTNANVPLTQLSAGVRLMQPVATYSLTDRAVKYAVLFIALTFTTLLVFELVTLARVHYVQYALIGTALALFYLLLLALSEHIGFALAYLIAAAAIVVMLTAYAAAALSSLRRALLIGLMQTITYSVLWAILALEDYALLTGTVALLVSLGLLMFFTRKLSARMEPNAAPG
jgi:inner membrane protein